jgi:hypothetical protein
MDARLGMRAVGLWRRSGLVGQFLPRKVPDEIRSRPVI